MPNKDNDIGTHSYISYATAQSMYRCHEIISWLDFSAFVDTDGTPVYHFYGPG